MSKHIAIYCRVSSRTQDTASQEPELKAWAASQRGAIKWYGDAFTGRSMNRPDWSRLMEEIRAGRVSAVVVWRLDRLGRTASGLTALFDELQERRVNLVSLKDGLDLSTPAGRLMANVLASVAQFETEVRSERQMAGIAAAKASGRTWGGSEKGRRLKVSEEHERAIVRMREAGESPTAIARVMKLSRPTVYAVLRKMEAVSV